MRLVTDPNEVQHLAEELQDENWAFRAWIKSNSDLEDEQLMSVVHWLAEEVTAQIDCSACANCCQTAGPSPRCGHPFSASNLLATRQTGKMEATGSLSPAGWQAVPRLRCPAQTLP